MKFKSNFLIFLKNEDLKDDNKEILTKIYEEQENDI